METIRLKIAEYIKKKSDKFNKNEMNWMYKKIAKKLFGKSDSKKQISPKSYNTILNIFESGTINDLEEFFQHK
jgi:hypothetical protein